MPTTPDREDSRPDAEQANEAIRRYVQAHGSRPWGEEERAELQRLRSVWLRAIQNNVRAAA
ncbi:hypothetical protein PJ985_09335 [Streptomyces sp. ACA25]|uniref:hypothetical protein n=1 Tax=Streptomyces sp. ACA25 TaxID=3022596 RepID=UPI00230714A6|nr:hypothetical protein [Streptomyces sp. ACA25]MDB1087766.1 hypothetical protein [Streptomyces sp. ACA25]